MVECWPVSTDDGLLSSSAISETASTAESAVSIDTTAGSVCNKAIASASVALSAWSNTGKRSWVFSPWGVSKLSVTVVKWSSASNAGSVTGAGEIVSSVGMTTSSGVGIREGSGVRFGSSWLASSLGGKGETDVDSLLLERSRKRIRIWSIGGPSAGRVELIM